MTTTSSNAGTESIFISYSRRDWESHVRPLVDRLRQAGFSVWVDQHLLQGGQDWRDEINAALDQCGRMILCVSPDALESKYVRLEYRYFLDENKPIIPVICREAKLLPELRPLQWIGYDMDALIQLLGRPAINVNDSPTAVITPPSIPNTLIRKLITSDNATTMRQEASLRGHDKPISSLTFAPNSLSLASASSDGLIKVWDMASRHEVLTLANRDALYDLEYSPDGKVLAAALGAKFGNTSTLMLWDVGTNQSVAQFGTHGTRLFEIVYSPDGTRIACACWDHTVTVWDVATQQKVGTLTGHTGSVSSVVFSADGSRMATGSWDGTIKLWDAESYALIGTLTGHTDQVNNVAFAPNGKHLASVSADQSVRLWNTHALEQIIAFNQGAPVWCCQFAPDGDILATGGINGAIKLWCMSTLKELSTIYGHQKPVLALDFSPNGSYMASGARDGSITVWSPAE